MARRPTRIPRWGYSASAGVLVEPPSAEAEAGWITGQRPPAQYLNWLFNLYGSWTSFFAGPSTSDWTRRELPNPSTDVARVAYDSVTEDNDEARYRYALVGKDGTSAFVAVSRTGIDWTTRRNIGGAPGDPRGVVPPPVDSEPFWLWTSAAGKTYYGQPDTVANAATNPLRNSGGTWTELALDDAAAYPVGFAEGPSAGAVGAICSTSTGIEYRANGVYSAWTTHASLPGARQEGRACCWTGTAFLDISSDTGDLCVSRATTASGTWTVVATVAGLSAGTLWRVAVGATSTSDAVIAVYKEGADVVDLHFSEDDGLTWTPATLPPAMIRVTGLAYYDGTWVAVSLATPYAWSSSDLETWTPLPIPAGDTITVLRDVVYGANGWLLTSRDGCLQGAPAIETTPGAWTADVAPSQLGNAGWLRGYRISATAPTSGQMLAWDGTAYTPTTPSGGGGAGLPAATGAGEVPVSTGAGTTYAASPISDEIGGVLAQFLGGTAGQTVIGDGTGDVTTTSADVSDFLASANADAARAAIGAGQGLPHLSLGAAYNAGSSATAYLDVAGTPSAAPLGGPGETLVYLFFPVGLPSDARIMAQHMDSGSNTRGWELRYGDNGGDRGLLALLLYGMNSNSPTDLTGATFNGALNVPHVLAIAITAGGVPRYSWDGGTVTALTALSGTYVPPISGDPFTIGSRSGGNYPADKAQIVQFRAYSTVLSDADLVAVAATRTSFVLADPSAGTLTTDLWAPNASGFGSVLDRADTARRWRVNGELKAQEQ
jgi:hypothetical protein